MWVTLRPNDRADLKIMVGIHGNGLTHEMWMPNRSVLVEVRRHCLHSVSSRLTRQLFPPETFLRDYEVIAEATGHSYFGIVSFLSLRVASLTLVAKRHRLGPIAMGGRSGGEALRKDA